MAEMPLIDREKCQGCGLCASVCTCGALIIVDNLVTVREVEDCGWCGMCELVCPFGAITCPFEIRPPFTLSVKSSKSFRRSPYSNRVSEETNSRSSVDIPLNEIDVSRNRMFSSGMNPSRNWFTPTRVP